MKKIDWPYEYEGVPIAVFARKQCLFGDKLKQLGPQNIDTGNETGFETIIAGAAASILVDGISNLLTNAGEDRTEEVSISMSFQSVKGSSDTDTNASTSGSPQCFHFFQNSNKGKIFLELALQHEKQSNSFRLIPTLLNYKQELRSYLIGNKSEKTLALSVSISAPGGEAQTVVLNLGHLKVGEVHEFNTQARKNGDDELIGLASNWFKMDIEKEKGAFNATFTLVETNSQSKLAGLLGAQIEANKETILPVIQNTLTREPLKDRQQEILDKSAKRETEISNFCGKFRPILDQAVQTGKMSVTDRKSFNEELGVMMQRYADTFNSLGKIGPENFTKETAKKKQAGLISICPTVPE